MELHYIEYLGAVPWRGYSRYVVDRIVDISSDKEEAKEIDIPSEVM